MATINQLSATDSLSAGDAFPVYVQAQGDARKVSLTVLAAAIQALLTSTDDKVTRYSAPNATGFSVALLDSDQSQWLVLTPVADYATGTIILPSLAQCADKQEILVSSSHAVAALTVNPNGSTIVGAPTALIVGGFFRLRYEGVTHTWYRAG